jgi:hypothetical protein
VILRREQWERLESDSHENLGTAEHCKWALHQNKTQLPNSLKEGAM